MSQNYPKTAVLAASKARKAKLLAGAAEFNAKPKKGVAFLKEHGIIDEEALPSERGTVLALAKFLHKQPRLDKKLLGEYLSHPDNLELLKAFIGLFDFKGVSEEISCGKCDLHLTKYLFRNPSPKLCESFLNPSDCRGRLSPSPESPRLLLSISSLTVRVSVVRCRLQSP